MLFSIQYIIVTTQKTLQGGTQECQTVPSIIMSAFNLNDGNATFVDTSRIFWSSSGTPSRAMDVLW